jgi:hypothetical protein
MEILKEGVSIDIRKYKRCIKGNYVKELNRKYFD